MAVGFAVVMVAATPETTAGTPQPPAGGWVVVEVHVPLVATPGVAEGKYQYPWILRVDNLVHAMDARRGSGVREFDDGEEEDDEYVWFLTGRDQQAVLAAASKIAARSDVPAGAYAVITDEASVDLGQGTRVDLPLQP